MLLGKSGNSVVNILRLSCLSDIQAQESVDSRGQRSQLGIYTGESLVNSLVAMRWQSPHQSPGILTFSEEFKTLDPLIGRGVATGPLLQDPCSEEHVSFSHLSSAHSLPSSLLHGCMFIYDPWLLQLFIFCISFQSHIFLFTFEKSCFSSCFKLTLFNI